MNGKFWLKFLVLLSSGVMLLVLGYRTELGRMNRLVGPRLVSEEQARAIALRETPISEVVETYLQTCGPIYRVVRGRTSTGREIVVWLNSEIVSYAYLDEGISADEVLSGVRQVCPHIDEVRLVYIPDHIKSTSRAEIRTAPGNVFWQIRFRSSDSISQAEASFRFVPFSKFP